MQWAHGISHSVGSIRGEEVKCEYVLYAWQQCLHMHEISAKYKSQEKSKPNKMNTLHDGHMNFLDLLNDSWYFCAGLTWFSTAELGLLTPVHQLLKTCKIQVNIKLKIPDNCQSLEHTAAECCFLIGWRTF